MMFGSELRKMRLNAKLTQEKVALDADLDRAYLSELESGKKEFPSLDVVFRLCKAMNVLPSKLVARVERQHPDFRNHVAKRGRRKRLS
jgi:transcriptional regulator with XRE-family HTH domain